jgi:hypothetical protein
MKGAHSGLRQVAYRLVISSTAESYSITLNHSAHRLI